MKRTYCGDVDSNNINDTLTLNGWVNTRRDHGGVVFIDLRDHTGLVQVVFNPDRKDVFDKAQSLRTEYVLEITGTVKRRLDGTVNEDMPTGEIELDRKSVV